MSVRVSSLHNCVFWLLFVLFCFVFVFWLDFNQIHQHHRHYHYLNYHRCHQFCCRHHHHITIVIIVVVVISGRHRDRRYVIIFVIVFVITIIVITSSSSLHHRRRHHIICNCCGHIAMESLCVLVKDATLTANSVQCPRGIKFTHIHGTRGGRRPARKFSHVSPNLEASRKIPVQESIIS